MNLTENKDAEKKAFEERSAKLKKPDWEVPDWEEIASIKDSWTRLQKTQEWLKQAKGGSTVLDNYLEQQANLASMTSSKPKNVDYSQSRQQYLERLEEVARKVREQEERDKEKVALLQDIKSNTNILQEMNYHLQMNTEHQKEIVDLMLESLAIMKSSNEEEAKSKLDKVKEKIEFLNTLNDTKETAKWLISMAKSAYIMFLTLSS